MGACKVEVDPGVCKLNTVIIAKPAEDMMSITFEVVSACPNIKKYAANVKDVDPYSTISMPMVENPLYVCAKDCIPHSACPVPCAMVKAMEVAADLGLKRDVKLTITDAE